MEWNQLRFELRNSLVNAFDASRLEQMLRYECNRRLDTIASSHLNLVEQVEEVIDSAEKQGWIEELLTGAIAAVPTNAQLQQAVQTIQAALQDNPSLTDTLLKPADSAPYRAELSRQELQNRDYLRVNVANAWLTGLTAPLRQVKEQWASTLDENSGQRLDPYIRLPFRWESNEMFTPRGQPSGWHEQLKIEQIYAKSGQRLLVLGRPGSGKTISLLNLAEALSKIAERTDSPMPVVLNLSSWESGLSLIEWIKKRMLLEYQIARDISENWIQNQMLHLLLDGLDEVSEAQRPACVASINDFLGSYTNGMVVGCRQEEYQQLEDKLNFSGAVSIQPLSTEDVEQYLYRFPLPAFHNDADELWQALQNYPTLIDMMRSPFILSLVPKVFMNMRPGSVSLQNYVSQTASDLFDEYIITMLRRHPRRGEGIEYDEREGLRRLKSLASLMKNNHESVFHIESIQPNWLAAAEDRHRYRLTVSLVSGFLIGLVYTLVRQLGTVRMIMADGWIGAAAEAAVVFAIGIWLVWKNVGTIELVEKFSPKQLAIRKNPLTALKQGGREGLLTFILMGGIFCLLELAANWADPQTSYTWRVATAAWIGYGLSCALVVFIFVALFVDPSPKPDKPYGIVRWEAIRRGSFLGMMLVPLLTVARMAEATGLSAALLSTKTVVQSIGFGIYVSMTIGFIGALSVILMTYLPKVASATTPTPNQGIRNSLQNAAIMGVIIGGTGGLAYTVFWGTFFGWRVREGWHTGILEFMAPLSAESGIFTDAAYGLFYGAMIGMLLGSFVYGGHTYVGHYALRWMLRKSAELPFPIQDQPMIDFLDDLARRGMLQRIGGGWIFIHRMMLEHFADLDTEHFDQLMDAIDAPELAN